MYSLAVHTHYTLCIAMFAWPLFHFGLEGSICRPIVQKYLGGQEALPFSRSSPGEMWTGYMAEPLSTKGQERCSWDQITASNCWIKAPAGWALPYPDCLYRVCDGKRPHVRSTSQSRLQLGQSSKKPSTGCVIIGRRSTRLCWRGRQLAKQLRPEL